MSRDLTLTRVCLDTDTEDEEGRLVFAGDYLVAVLVQLADGHEAKGHWFLEHGFGRLGVPVPPTFSDLQAAGHWIAARLRGVTDGHATTVPTPDPSTLPL